MSHSRQLFCSSVSPSWHAWLRLAFKRPCGALAAVRRRNPPSRESARSKRSPCCVQCIVRRRSPCCVRTARRWYPCCVQERVLRSSSCCICIARRWSPSCVQDSVRCARSIYRRRSPCCVPSREPPRCMFFRARDTLLSLLSQRSPSQRLSILVLRVVDTRVASP